MDSSPGATQGALALDLRRRETQSIPGRSAATWHSRARHLEPVNDPDDDASEDSFFARQPTPRAALPDPKPFCGRYVQALVEVLSGDRPLAQLMRWTSEDIYADLRHRVRVLSQAVGRPFTSAGGGLGQSAGGSVGSVRGRASGAGGPGERARPGHGGSAGSRGGSNRAIVRSVHVQEPRDGVAEACVHVSHAGKSRAIAVRLEGLDGHWRCTALQLG